MNSFFIVIAIIFIATTSAQKPGPPPPTPKPTPAPTPPPCSQDCIHYATVITRSCNLIPPGSPTNDMCGHWSQCYDEWGIEIKCMCYDDANPTQCAQDYCRCSTAECAGLITTWNNLNCAANPLCPAYTCTA